MLSDRWCTSSRRRHRTVLILVLMEYALWLGESLASKDINNSLNPCSNGICSLTVEEKAKELGISCLNPCSKGICSLTTTAWTGNKTLVCVLILVLMEYALWQKYCIGVGLETSRLNPCSNGICSLTRLCAFLHYTDPRSLNPCSNGICSLTQRWRRIRLCVWRLNPCSNGICSLTQPLAYGLQIGLSVLILVLMEYALWPAARCAIYGQVMGLNPCSNGICSLTSQTTSNNGNKTQVVLILVLMEYALWLWKFSAHNLVLPAS